MTYKQRAEIRGGDGCPPKPKPKLKAAKSVPVLPAGPVPRLQSSRARKRTVVVQIPVCSHANLRRVNDPPRVVMNMNNDIAASALQVPGPYLEPIVTKCNRKQACVANTRIPPPRVLRTRREFSRDKGGKKVARSLSERFPGESQGRKPVAYLVVDLQTGMSVFSETVAESKPKAIGCEGQSPTKSKPPLPSKTGIMSRTGGKRPLPLPRKKSLKKHPLSPPTAAMETEDRSKAAEEPGVVRRESPLPLASEQSQEAEESSLADRVQQFVFPTTKSVSEPQDRPRPVPRPRSFHKPNSPRPIPRPRSFSKSPSPTLVSQFPSRHSAPADLRKSRNPPGSPTVAPAAPREHRPPKPNSGSNSKAKPARPPPPSAMALQRAKANKAASLRTSSKGPKIGLKKKPTFLSGSTQSLRPTSTSNSHAGLKTKPLSQPCSSVQAPSSRRTAAAMPLPITPHAAACWQSSQQSRATEAKAHPDYEDIDPDDEPKAHPDYEDIDPDEEPKTHPDYEDIDSDDDQGDVVEIPLSEVPSTPPPRLPPKPQSTGKPSFQRMSREMSVSSIGSPSVISIGSLASISEQNLQFEDDDHVYEPVDTSVPIAPPRRKRKPKSGSLSADRTRSNTLSPRLAPSKAPLQPPPKSDPLKRKETVSRTVSTSSLATTAPSRIPSSGNSSVLRGDTSPLPNEERTRGGIVGDSAGVDRREGVGLVLEEPDVGGMDDYVDFDPAPAWEQVGGTEPTQLDMENDHPSESYVEMHPSMERPRVTATEPISEPLYIEMNSKSYVQTPGLYYASKDLLAERPDLKANKKGSN